MRVVSKQKTIAIESILQITNSINQSSNLYRSPPTKYPNNRLSTLGIKLWLETVKYRLQLFHSYCIKPIDSKYVIHKNLALSQTTTIHILMADLAMLKNYVFPLCEPYESKKTIQYFMHRV